MIDLLKCINYLHLPGKVLLRDVLPYEEKVNYVCIKQKYL